LDVIKDRLYCDAMDSQRRMSALSTVYDIAHSLVRMIAPIVPMTAEEMWEFLPGANAKAASIHLQNFAKVTDVAIDNAAWAKFFAMREQVNTALDIAKKDKIVGSSIAAKVSVLDLDLGFAESLNERYEQLLMMAEVTAGDALSIQAAEGVKCPRCWNVGKPADASHAIHNEICPRCFDVVVA